MRATAVSDADARYSTDTEHRDAGAHGRVKEIGVEDSLGAAGDTDDAKTLTSAWAHTTRRPTPEVIRWPSLHMPNDRVLPGSVY